MSKETFDVLTVIAIRKAEFYERSRNQLLKSLPGDLNKDEVSQALRKAISEVDNNLFIGRKEKDTKIIDPSTPIEKLGLDTDRIISEVIHKLPSV